MMNFHYSPAHRIIPKTFRRFIVWLIRFIPFFSNEATIAKTKNTIIGELIGFIFQMFGVLMFVEVLIVGVCGINSNIESEITKREMKEYDSRKEGLFSIDSTIGKNSTNDDIELLSNLSKRNIN